MLEVYLMRGTLFAFVTLQAALKTKTKLYCKRSAGFFNAYGKLIFKENRQHFLVLSAEITMKL